MHFSSLASGSRRLRFVDLPASAGADFVRLPWLTRLLLENVLRQSGRDDAAAGKAAILGWLATGTSEAEIQFVPGRVLMHDTTCVPALVDVAAMRSALAEAGGDPARLNPVLPVDVSIDHSRRRRLLRLVRTPSSRNMAREFGRNARALPLHEVGDARAQGSCACIRPAPASCTPSTSSAWRPWSRPRRATASPGRSRHADRHRQPHADDQRHRRARLGRRRARGRERALRHAGDAAHAGGDRRSAHRPPARGRPVDRPRAHRHRAAAPPRPVGAVRRVLRPGPVPRSRAGDRAVVANMAPEYGATSGFFPVDEQTLPICARPGAPPSRSSSSRPTRSGRASGSIPTPSPRYTDTIEIDLGEDRASASPARAGRRIASPPSQTVEALAPAAGTCRSRPGGLTRASRRTAPSPSPRSRAAPTPADPRLTRRGGPARPQGAPARPQPPALGEDLARARARRRPSAISRRAGLLEDLEALGFGIVGYGCTTCIGNSGPLTAIIEQA